ncbi:MAG: hypothetical protein O7D32_01365 [bacterium]|nr:hypothetical protein [bacterium]
MCFLRLLKLCGMGFVLATMIPASGVTAEPCMLVYTPGTTLFNYDPGRYSALTSESSNYDRLYALGGTTLWDDREDRIAYEAYQAPGLTAFQQSYSGHNEFLATGRITHLIVDGFTTAPTQFADVVLQFSPVPANARPEIFVDGELVSGLRHIIPAVRVSTSIGHGFYSDLIELEVRWTGAVTLEVISYADRNGNRILDGPACFVAILIDGTVRTQGKTWGGIKALFENK